MLDDLLDAFRIRQYFNAVTMTREALEGVRDDVTFLRELRRALLPLPGDMRGAAETNPFPHPRPARTPKLQGRRVAVLATGGSGALASVVGVARAFEEVGIRPVALSLCSGSALFGFPIAAGRSADEVAEFTLDLSAADLVDMNWRGLVAMLPTGGRGFTGFLHGERVEDAYHDLLGDMTLGEMPIPAYAPVWDVEHNRVEYIGSRTHPELPVALAVRMAVALPLFIEAVGYRGQHYYDGGTADIFPVHPLLDIEPRPDVVVAVNGFYPPEFEGDDVSGWVDRFGSIFQAAAQVRTIQHLQLARENLARLRREVHDVRLIHPVPYSVVRGVGLYRQFIDSSRWPDFMRAGRMHTLRALETIEPSRRRSAPASSPRGDEGNRPQGKRNAANLQRAQALAEKHEGAQNGRRRVQRDEHRNDAEKPMVNGHDVESIRADVEDTGGDHHGETRGATTHPLTAHRKGAAERGHGRGARSDERPQPGPRRGARKGDVEQAEPGAGPQGKQQGGPAQPDA